MATYLFTRSILASQASPPPGDACCWTTVSHFAGNTYFTSHVLGECVTKSALKQDWNDLLQLVGQHRRWDFQD
jgi:hypothetical protein